jgi:hypothetical protein
VPRYTDREQPRAYMLSWIAAALAFAFVFASRAYASSLLNRVDLRLSADEYALLLAFPTDIEARRALGLDDEGRCPHALTAVAACAHIWRPLLERRAAWDAAGGGRQTGKPTQTEWNGAFERMRDLAATSPACADALREVRLLQGQEIYLYSVSPLAYWMVHGLVAVQERHREEQEMLRDPNPMPRGW